ncbi:MAG TPA: hypothetical protein VH307_06840 [Streptosporangiaceae bacterium]|nr:hypothetical protein [Streptosporangiaceae bacterium]
MSATHCIISSVVVLLVLRQIREARLDLASLLLPVALVSGAAAYYLHPVPTAGNDVLLDLTLGAAGALPGALCAPAARIRRGTAGVALVRAGWLAGIL